MLEQRDIMNINNEKWYMKLLFLINVLLWSWNINKKFGIGNRIYDNLLVMLVSLILYIIGLGVWIL